MKYKMICEQCGVAFDESAQNISILRCQKCGGCLRADFDWQDNVQKLVKAFRNAPEDIWTYREFFPVGEEEPVTLREGNTPLVRCDETAKTAGIRELHIKNEGLNPSGTYKDRGISVSMTRARAMGAKAVILGSAGNAGASAAAYAAKAHIPCFLILPAGALKSREQMARLYGAHVIRIDGTIDDAIRLSAEIQRIFGFVNMSTAHVYNPYCVEGYKSIGYELAWQFHFEMPDVIITPVGGGSLLTKIWEGLSDAKRLGLLHKLPRMVGVQGSGCAPLVRAYKEGKPPVRWENPDTIAFAIADEWPHDGGLALNVIKESGGVLEDVDDTSILHAQRLLCSSEAVFAEAASATPLAGLFKLRRTNIIKKNERVVLIVSGTGFKDIEQIAKDLYSVSMVKNDVKKVINEIRKIIDKKIENKV